MDETDNGATPINNTIADGKINSCRFGRIRNLLFNSLTRRRKGRRLRHLEHQSQPILVPVELCQSCCTPDNTSSYSVCINDDEHAFITAVLQGISGHVTFLISIKYKRPLSDELVHAIKLQRYYFKAYQIIEDLCYRSNYYRFASYLCIYRGIQTFEMY